MRHGRSDWSRIAKHRICIRFRTTCESGLGLIWKNRICAVQTVIRKSDMGHIGQKSDLGHFSLQCELSHNLQNISYVITPSCNHDFKSCIVFQFLTKLPATGQFICQFLFPSGTWWVLILNPFAMLQEAAVFTWGCKGHTSCCTCPLTLIGAELAWFAQSFCPVTIGCGPNQLTITALLLVVLPPVNVIPHPSNEEKHKLEQTEENYKIAIKWEVKHVFFQQLLY